MLYDVIVGNSWLIILGLIAFGVVWLNRRGDTGAARQRELESVRNKERDGRWLEYIGSFRAAAETDHERLIIDTMLNAGTVDDVTKVAGKPASAERPASEAVISRGTVAQVPDLPAPSATAQYTAAANARPLDGTLLLLYFGAFLFVAAAGLFVAFGNFSGALRTFLVFLTMAVMYGGGLWLYGRSERLKPAGMSFVAIGLAVAPLVGVAANTYLSASADGRVIWLLTSLLCLGLYGHALYRLRTTLLPYLFIASFVSVFESSIAILDVPAPYFVWGLILAGLALKAFSISKRSQILNEPADRSAQLLVPLSTAAALFMIPDHGTGQLCGALVLAAAYYTLESYSRAWANNGVNAAAHVLYLAALVSGTFAISDSMHAIAVILLVAAALHAIVLYVLPAGFRYARDGATVAFAIPVVATILAFDDGILVSAALAAVALLGVLIAVRQRRTDAYVGGAAGLILLPLALGQMVAEPRFGFDRQSAASFIVVMVLLLVMNRIYGRRDMSDWREPAMAMYAVAGIAAVLPAWMAGGWTSIAGTAGLSLTLAWVARFSGEERVWAASGALLALPIVLLLGDTDTLAFSVAVIVALVGNIAAAVWRHQEPNRWLVSGIGLLLPVAVGAGGMGITFSVVGYTYAYLGVMAGLVLCRAVARWMTRAQEATASAGSLPRRASISYAAGYVAAAILAVLISLGTDASRLHTSIVLAVLLMMSVFLSLRVESKREILAFSPWIAQALLVSLMRPTFDSQVENAAILSSIGLAALLFGAADELRARLGGAGGSVRRSALAATYLPVWLGMFYEEDAVVLPFGLALAGCLTLYYFWDRSQKAREISGGVIMLSIWWLLSSLDVDNLQVYTHVLAATFALYAYWRHRRQEPDQSLEYLRAMFLVASIPLALQALGGTSGDIYGWLFILQQVGFMILGIFIHRRFLVWWGLYMSVAAVIFQLRNLGWAAMILLALFVIGVAVYRLLRASDEHNKP